MSQSRGNILTIIWAICVAIAFVMFTKGILNALRSLRRR